MSAPGIRRGAAALRRAPETADAAELDMVDDGVRNELQPVVVAGPGPLRPEVLRLAQRHVHREGQVAAGDGDVVVVRHGPIIVKEHYGNKVTSERRRRQRRGRVREVQRTAFVVRAA